ncbi:hypothetical protein JW935_07390 [candidate division KSB1 bacterium]|nr:hypothetical protein [candidate division KSB1 bacterium]
MTEKELENATGIFLHKLKNPVHAASLNLDALELVLAKKNADKKTQQLLKIIRSEMQRTLTIVSRFSEYVRSDQKQKIDLGKYLDRKSS